MIYQKEVSTGKVVGKFLSYREAATAMGCTHPSILKAVKIGTKSCGFFWSDSDDSSDSDIDNETKTVTNQYKEFNSPSAWSQSKGRFLSIEEFCDTYGLDFSTVKSSKLVTHNAGHMTYNIAFFSPEEDVVNDIMSDLEGLIKKHITPIPIPQEFRMVSYRNKWTDRLVYTDVHIGMDVNAQGDPLYDGKWDREEAIRRLDIMIKHVLEHQSATTLIIDDLGDFLDGLGGQTARKGHDLPQNMNDKEAFDLAVEFKLILVDSLISDYDTIVCNNITDDNHAHNFGYFACQAVKGILEERYKGRVFVNNRRRFIEHYTEGQHTFLLCHGKDSSNLKFGFKPILDGAQAEKIDQYCKEHKLYNGNLIEFSKGDSHQAIFDETTSNDFDYYSYPSFSPPSNWVKTNYKNSRSGFRLFNIDRTSQKKVHIPYYF